MVSHLQDKHTIIFFVYLAGLSKKNEKERNGHDMILFDYACLTTSRHFPNVHLPEF